MLKTFLQPFHRHSFQNLAELIAYQGVIDEQIDFIDNTSTEYRVTPLIIAAGKGNPSSMCTRTVGPSISRFLREMQDSARSRIESE